MEENEDFVLFDQPFSEAEIYLFEQQLRKEGMIQAPDRLYSEIDIRIQDLRSENSYTSHDIPLEILHHLLFDERWRLRQWAIDHVVEVMKEHTPVQFIVTALNDTHEEVRLSALQSCKLLGPKDIVFIINKIAKALYELQIMEQPALYALKLLGKLIIDLQEVDQNIVFDIPLEVPRFMALDKRWQIRQWVVKYIMSILKEHAPVDLVISALSDTHEEIRLSAIHICAAMGDRRAVLVKAIVDAISCKQVAENAAFQALGLLQNLALEALKSSSEYAAAKNVNTVAEFHFFAYWEWNPEGRGRPRKQTEPTNTSSKRPRVRLRKGVLCSTTV